MFSTWSLSSRRRHDEPCHGRQGRQGGASRSRPQARSRGGVQRARLAVPLRSPAEPVPGEQATSGGASPLASCAQPAAAGSFLTNPTPSVQAASSFGSVPASLAGGPITNGRMSFRLSEWDLKARDRDGVGAELACRLRGPCAVLRQSGEVHRRHRDARRHPIRTGRCLSRTAAAQGSRAPGPGYRKETRHPLYRQPPRGHHALHQRTRCLPLLRPMRTRLPDGVRLLRQSGRRLPGAQDR